MAILLAGYLIAAGVKGAVPRYCGCHYDAVVSPQLIQLSTDTECEVVVATGNRLARAHWNPIHPVDKVCVPVLPVGSGGNGDEVARAVVLGGRAPTST